MAGNPGFRMLLAAGGGREDHVLGVAAKDGRLELLECVSHAAAAVGRASELAPDVVVLDEELADGGLQAAIEIAARLPGVPVVVTHGDDDAGLIDALAAGASAYVARDARADELAATIVGVAGGEVVLTPEQVRRVVDALRDPTRPRRRLDHLPELTAREWQVLELMHNRFSTPEIAERLVVSPVTVRSHARSIRRKLAPSSGGRSRSGR